MRRTLLAVLVGLLVVGCGGSDGDGRPNRQARVYEALLSAVVAREFPLAGADAVPVVYALPDPTEPLPADVQVAVVKAMKGHIDLRFADERAEAIDSSEADEPVRDDGILVSLGEVPGAGTTFDVEVKIYRNLGDRSSFVISVVGGPDAWTVTSMVPAG